MVPERHFEGNEELLRPETLLQMADALVRYSTMAELSAEWTQRLHRLFPFELAGSCIHDASKNVMKLLIWEGDHSLRLPIELPVDGTIGGWVWKNQRPILFDDVQKETRFDASLRLLKELGVHSFCEVPLTTSQRRLGALWLANTNGYIYGEKDVQLLCRVADLVSLAMENVLMRAAVQHEKQRLETLLSVSSFLMTSLDAEKVMPAVSEFVQKTIQHDFASLSVYEEDNSLLRVHTLRPPGKSEAPGCETEELLKPGSDPSFLYGDAKIRDSKELLETGSTLYRGIVEQGIQSLCSIPLISRKGTLGVLHIGSHRPGAFVPQDLSFLRQVGAQIALALDNDSAYRQIEKLTRSSEGEKLYLQDEVRSVLNFEEIIGDSPSLRRVLAQVQTVAARDTTVLILGETGTGKELVARAIHRMSGRKGASFIKLNCAAIPTGLLESELFGHEKGAFTGAISQKVGRLELADKGTLFLDEIGEIPLELQPKLLRALQDQEFERLGGVRTIRVNIRLIAATNRDLPKAVAAGEFRSDLFYRLHVFPVRLPALRERGKDIPLLVHYFVQKFARRMNKHIVSIPSETMNALVRWGWPGNVRELENFIERSVILTDGTTLHAPLSELMSTHEGAFQDSTLENMEREHIVRVLRETSGVIAGVHGAAARLGLKRTTLQSRMQRMGINRTEYEN
jgi:formate hydrogenlyase transcriptional activator